MFDFVMFCGDFILGIKFIYGMKPKFMRKDVVILYVSIHRYFVTSHVIIRWMKASREATGGFKKVMYGFHIDDMCWYIFNHD